MYFKALFFYFFSKTTQVYENFHRPQIRHVIQNGTMLSDGTLGKMSGFHEYLISKHPSVKQRISSWLTDGLKVQSIRLKNSKKEIFSKHKPPGKLRNNITERKLFIHRDLSEQEAEGEDIESKIFELRISSIQPSGWHINLWSWVSHRSLNVLLIFILFQFYLIYCDLFVMFIYIPL